MDQIGGASLKKPVDFLKGHIKMIAQETLDRKAAAAGQLLADAAEGYALLNALSAKWYEQGRNAAQMGINPAAVTFWTPDHQRGYFAALMETARVSA